MAKYVQFPFTISSCFSFDLSHCSLIITAVAFHSLLLSIIIHGLTDFIQKSFLLNSKTATIVAKVNRKKYALFSNLACNTYFMDQMNWKMYEEEEYILQ